MVTLGGSAFTLCWNTDGFWYRCDLINRSGFEDYLDGEDPGSDTEEGDEADEDSNGEFLSVT